MVSLSNIGGNLTDTEFAIGGTRFFISKLPAMAGFDLLEVIGHELGKSTSLRVPDATSEGAVGSLLQMVLSPDPSFVAYVRKILFERVAFSNRLALDPMRLAGSEDMAFGGLEPVAIYEVLARALAVKFTESWQYAVSKFQNVSLGSIPSAPSE